MLSTVFHVKHRCTETLWNFLRNRGEVDPIVSAARNVSRETKHRSYDRCFVVDPSGFEPLTSAMRMQRSTNWATGPKMSYSRPHLSPVQCFTWNIVCKAASSNRHSSECFTWNIPDIQVICIYCEALATTKNEAGWNRYMACEYRRGSNGIHHLNRIFVWWPRQELNQQPCP